MKEEKHCFFRVCSIFKLKLFLSGLSQGQRRVCEQVPEGSQRNVSLQMSVPCCLWKVLSVVWLRAAFPDLLVLRCPGKIPNAVLSFLGLNFIPKFISCVQSCGQGSENCTHWTGQALGAQPWTLGTNTDTASSSLNRSVFN